MRRIPEITAVHAWDATRQRQYTPTNLTAGMGVRITLTGEESKTWRRSATPVRGLVELRPGRNLVAWAGQETTIADATRGIGTSLIRSWKADGSSAVKRGDALWVDVSRNVNWLQPTGLIPTIRFTGGVTKEIQNRIREDVLAAIALFRKQYGIEADASTLWIYAAVDQESLIESLRVDALRDDFPARHSKGDFSWVRGSWSSSGAWVQGNNLIFVKQQHWRDSNHRIEHDNGSSTWRGRAFMVHEYSHIVQAQLSTIESLSTSDYFGDIGYWRSNSPTWLYEGAATWVEDAQLVSDGLSRWNDAMKEAVDEIADGSSLAQVTGLESYPVGRAAMYYLREQAGEDAWLEIFRSMAPLQVGPQLRWVATPSWHRAVEIVTGTPIDEFYREFESWRTENYASTHRIGGKIEWEEAQGTDSRLPELDVRDLRIMLWQIPSPGKRPVTWPDARGRFAFGEVTDGEYRVEVDLGGCKIFYPGGYGSYGEERIIVAGDDVTDIQIRLDMTTCVYQISGRLLDSQGHRVSGQMINIRADTREIASSGRTAANGSYAITVPAPGSFRLAASLDGCTVYYRDGGTTGSWRQATVVAVDSADARAQMWMLGADTCRYRISGALLNSDGTARVNEWVTASGDAGSAGASTTGDGSFSFAVPGRGSYNLMVHVDGCRIYRGARGPTTDWNSAGQVTVSNADITGIEFRLPEDPASFCD